MLQRVNEIAFKRRLKQKRNVPNPERDGVDCPRDERIRDKVPDSLNRFKFNYAFRTAAPLSRHRPHCCNERLA